MNSTDKLKDSVKKLKRKLTIASVFWPLLIILVAGGSLVLGKIQSRGLQAAAWIGIGASIVSVAIYIYCQLTMPDKEGFNKVTANVVTRFLLRVAHVELSILIGVPVLSKLIDHLLSLKPMIPAPYNYLGLVVFVPALLLEIWTLYIFITKGKGTPIPLEATQHLITEGPYRYVRNPMEIGTTFITGGMAVIFGSYTLLLIFIFTALHSLEFSSGIEDIEMTDRFGQEWLDYKTRVPMWIPRLRCTKH
jgi:protein-S-isoprenylcysteine O-methyltransferase Ste14